MMGRTHDLAAFTALNVAFVVYTPGPLSLATLIVALGANMVGGLLPDIDDATADIWDKVRFGSLLGKIIKPLIGGHRMISHSFLGLGIIGFVLNKIMPVIGTVLLVDMDIVWWSLMIGYLSHLITDSLTTQGVPWFFPLPVRIGFPPIRRLRVKTGGLMEKIIVFPGLLLSIGYMVYTNYQLYLTFLRGYIK
jgi:inner membrane protein